MSSEETSEDEERNAALQDALQCTFVQQVFNGIGHNSNSNTSLPLIEKGETKNKRTFEDTIAKILAKRLDEKIKETKIKAKKSQDNCAEKEKCGIQLIKSGRIITSKDLGDVNLSTKKKPQVLPKKIKLNDRIYDERAEVIAVTPEWVISQENTKYWKDNKKPRIINMKTLKTSDKGAITCHVLNDG